MSFGVQHPLEHDIEPSMNNVYGHICPSPRSFIDLTNSSLRLRSWICSRPLTVVCPWLQLILPILYVWDDLTSCIKYAFDSISRRKVHKYWQSSECSQTKNASHIHGKIKWTKFVHQIFSFTHKAFIFCKVILREETVDLGVHYHMLNAKMPLRKLVWVISYQLLKWHFFDAWGIFGHISVL